MPEYGEPDPNSPLPFREIYDRWQRSKTFGDPRDVNQFSKDMNEATGTRAFDAGVNAGWWTKASTGADVNFFEPIARQTGLEAAGRGIGGLFGDPYKETGARIARSLPRTIAQTAPLIAAEVLSGGAATPVVAGALATGGLFGAQTYAETGSPIAAAISGATAAALPAVGRIGGEIGLRTLGPEVERVATKTGMQTLPKVAKDAFRYKAARLAGSQAAMIGTLQGSSALQAKELGVPYDPFAPDFWAQQIPFSFLDIAQTARARVPTAAQAKLPPRLPKWEESNYRPPQSTIEEQNNLSDMLDRVTGVAKDQNITPEEKSQAFADLLGAVQNPEASQIVKPDDRIILIGHPKAMDNGSVKLYGLASKYYDLPEHGNVFINDPKSATQFTNPDGSTTYITSRKNVSRNVKYPLGPLDFPALRQKGQTTLPEQAPKVESGIDPTTDLLTLRQKFGQAASGNKMLIDAAVAKEPKDPTQAVAYWTNAIDKMTPKAEKDPFGMYIDSGEKAALQEAGVSPEVLTNGAALQFPDGQIFTGATHGHAYLEAEKAGLGDQVPSATGFIKNGQFEPGESITEGMYIDQPVKDVGNDIRKTQELLKQVDQIDKQITQLTGDTLTQATHKYVQKQFGRISYSDEVDQQLGQLFDQRRAIEDQLPESAFELRATVDHINEVKSAAQTIEISHAAVADAMEKVNTVPQTVGDLLPLFDLAPRSSKRSGGMSVAMIDTDGKVHYNVNATTHGDLYDQLGSKADTTIDAGFIDNQGFYHSGTDYGSEADAETLQTIKKYNEKQLATGRKPNPAFEPPTGLEETLLKQKLESSIKEGATPTQAVEKARLQQETPKVDVAKQQANLAKADIQQLHEQLLALAEKAKPVQEPLINPETGKPLTGGTPEERELLRAEANKRLKEAKLPTGGVAAKEGFPEKPQAIYGEPVRDENGKNFKTRELATAFRDADPDLEGYTVRDAGGKKGFYLAKQMNVETSIEGEPGRSLENVLAAEEPETIQETIAREATETPETTFIADPPVSTAPENRPSLSFNDYLGQLDMASNAPTRMMHAGGFEDVPETIQAIRQFRAALRGSLSEGKTDLKSVNESLKKAGVLPFDNEKEMQNVFRQVREGLDEFTKKYRSVGLDSVTPHDRELAAEMGIQQPNGLTNFLDWYIQNQPDGMLKELATALRKYSDFSHVDLTHDPDGFYYEDKAIVGDGRPRINLSRLAANRDEAVGPWGSVVMQELAHDSTADLLTRTDPAATAFKADLERIREALIESKQIPKEVRNAIRKSINEDWYGQQNKGVDILEKYNAELPGRDQWKSIFYSLQNGHEMVGGIFGSPELIRLMQDTKMPNTKNPILNFFGQVWARAFGYQLNAGNAFAKLIGSYDNYLSGTKMSRGYNGMSYIRDSLLAEGTHMNALASRMNTVSDTYANGDLSASIKGFEREGEEGILPATTAYGPVNVNLKTALIQGDANAVKDASMNLLADELPQHQELWARMNEDLKIAKTLYEEAKKGNVPAELSIFQEGLKNQSAKLGAMRRALEKQAIALDRWQTLDALGGNDGIQRLWSASLKGDKTPDPLDQTGNEDIARQALGLEAPSAEFITNRRREIAETGAKPMSWLDRMFKFATFTSEEQPGFKPTFNDVKETQSDAYRRMMELNIVKNSDARTQGWSKEIAAANKRVAQTPGLERIVSDMLRRANVLEKMHEEVSFKDPEMQEAIRRASDAKRRNGRSDRDDVITAFNSEGARSQHRVDKIVPEHLAKMNEDLTALAIIGREIGMPAEKAFDLSRNLYKALGMLRDPATAPQGAEALRVVAGQMHPDTFLKVLNQTNGFISDAEKHIARLQKYRWYTGEQRYGNFHLVMSREGEPLRESYDTEKAARSRAKDLQTDGWVLEDIVPKNRTNTTSLWGSDPVLSSMQELDQQALNRLETVIADLPVEKQAAIRPLIERAADYQSSAAAFSPVPTQASPRRKFVTGRETLNMIANANQETSRFVNWMRHRETRVRTAVRALDPELLGNRPLREYTQGFVDSQLAPDNPVARRLAEATFYWNLAGNLGVDFLHSIQSLTTGMASVIRETGSTGDALKYVGEASAKVGKLYASKLGIGKGLSDQDQRFINWLTARGGAGLPAWGEIFDPTTMNYFDSYGPQNTAGKTLNAIKNGVRGYKGIFLRHNDMVGGLAGFQLGLDRGMSFEDAARLGEGIKDRGFYSGGKAQRSVGMWNVRERAIPQLFGALRTYTLGWFSQLAHNYKVGFQDAPGDFSPAQRQGAKQAFLYMLGAQAVLAGALGLPGVGQGLGLLKQTTGTDLKAWTRKNLAAMFGEDQDDYGGVMTGMALHGLVSQIAPFDPSGRHIPNFPFIGVTPQKGFDISSLMPAPFTTAADIIGGLGMASKGGNPLRALPVVARGPISLLQGGGDVRNSRGELLYKLSSGERIVSALGLENPRIAAAKETAETVRSMNEAAASQKGKLIDEVATLYRKGDIQRAQKRLAEVGQQNPTYDMASFVRAVSTAVEKQTIPFDWKREVNPALDIVGLASNQPSRELERLQLKRGVASGLGLYERPNLRADIRAASVDQLMNADPYTTRAVALQRLLTTRQRQRRNILPAPEGYQ